MENAIRIVQIGQTVVIGDWSPGKLAKPRLIGRNQEGADIFMEVIGRPEEITLTGHETSWAVTDKVLLAGYRQAVTGLIMAGAPAPANVVNIGGGLRQ